VKILIRATNWVGDAIMALPALRAVRKRFPDAEITIVARPYVADIYRDQEICDQLIPYDPKGLHAGFSGRERLAAELRARKFDVALLLQNAFDAAWLAWRARIPERIGYARHARSFLLTHSVPLPRQGEIPAHETYYYLELLRRAGWGHSVKDETFIGLRVPDEKRRSADEFLSKSGVRQGAMRIAVAAGASYGSAKCWPPLRFAEVANRLQWETEAEIILFGTAGRPLISPGKPQLPICLRCSRSASSSSATIPARCTLLLLLACPSSPCLAPPIRTERPRSRRAAALFSKSLTAAHVFSAAARPIIGA